jgi:predicted anti-sigma-YlaC factor YlaD
LNDDELLPEGVRDVIPLLGPYAFGALDVDERTEVEAALASSELVRMLYRDVAEAAAALGEADPAHIDDRDEPPPELEHRILAAARRRTPPWRAITAAAASVVILTAGFVVATRDDAPAVPREAVTFASATQGVQVVEAALIAHTWGTELELVVDGVEDGVTYTVSFLDEAGNRVDAGSFLGVADGPVDCRMNAALLRDDATGLVVRDATGEVVLEADLA